MKVTYKNIINYLNMPPSVSPAVTITFRTKRMFLDILDKLHADQYQIANYEFKDNAYLAIRVGTYVKGKKRVSVKPLSEGGNLWIKSVATHEFLEVPIIVSRVP